MSRWVVHARADFEARHALTRYLGRPEESHSHLWAVAIRVGVESLGDEGYALDFHAVRRLLVEAVAPLAGSDLNLDPEVGRPSPTAERLAEVLAARLAPPLAALGGALLTVTVWEGPENRVDLNLEQA
jgi:6-pyruvoyl-tetrahydropterin synthase